MKLLYGLINSFDPENPYFRPTEIFNESWLIKLVLHQSSTINCQDSLISFLPKSTWFSEGLLPTAFKARYRGDELSESRTNADGVIVQISVGEKHKADLELNPNATQFTVVEAKVGSPLSAGVSKAKYFDQAARNVACMAEVLAQSNINPSSVDRLSFIVLAPQYSIDKDAFAEELEKKSIRSKVKKRVDAYNGDLDDWFGYHFEPTLANIDIHSLSWETAIKWISDHNQDIGNDLTYFYELCLKYK